MSELKVGLTYTFKRRGHVGRALRAREALPTVMVSMKELRTGRAFMNNVGAVMRGRDYNKRKRLADETES